MRFKEGDKVQFIANNELIIGTIKRVNNDVGLVDLKVSDLSWFFRKLEDVVKVKEPELIAVPRFAADWINHCKQREYDLSCLLDYEDSDMSAEMNDWLSSEDSNQSACSSFEETKEWLVEVGYQHADVFMEKIAYNWDEWEEEDD